MTDPSYQSYHQIADNLRSKFHDSRDLPDHPATQHLTRQFDELRADIASGKSPRAIQDRARGIQRQIWQAQHTSQGIMSGDSSNYFHNELEHFSDSLRQHPHFN